MSIQARYPGLCPVCEEYWVKGDIIETNEFGSQWQHAVCPASVAPRENPVCPTCFIAHAGPCDD